MAGDDRFLRACAKCGAEMLGFPEIKGFWVALRAFGGITVDKYALSLDGLWVYVELLRQETNIE